MNNVFFQMHFTRSLPLPLIVTLPLTLILALSLALSACGDDDDDTSDTSDTSDAHDTSDTSDPADLDPAFTQPLAGGASATARDQSHAAFSRPWPALDQTTRDAFFVGNSFFNKNWVIAPSSTTARDGLGPTFNATSCSACHLFDGRSSPPLDDDDPLAGLLIRLSIPGEAQHGAPNPHPTYGDQLNPFSIPGVAHEATYAINWQLLEHRTSDNRTVELTRPEITLFDWKFGDPGDELLTSPRTAPAMIGLGLLEAIDEADILANEDPDDVDNDGISGRANRVYSLRDQKPLLGRFGWKSNQPTIEQQVAGAFLGDIGITSDLFPNENCPASQADCTAAPNGGTPELAAETLAAVVSYSRTLAVPARRDTGDPTVLRGAALFAQTNCIACHTPTFTVTTVDGVPDFEPTDVHPYTDLLLHDMGDGLADNRPDFAATGNEWRTPPLWGIGLVETVNKHTRFLHDGRARNLEEAIYWHDGESRASREAFEQLSAADRAALLAFLRSL